MITSKKDRKRLFISQNEVPNQEILAPETIIRERLKKHFRNHIGREEATNPVEIFEQVLEMDPYDLDIYRKAYWWNTVKKAMKSLKHEVFIVHRADKYFVLKTEDEVKDYDITMERSKGNITESQKRAHEWVKEKKWRHF